MEVSTSPPKWKFLRKDPLSREERVQRVKAYVLDDNDETLIHTELCENADTLEATIKAVPPGSKIRIIIAQDLSRDLIETLGIPFDLDPQFFREYTDDYLYYRVGDPWVVQTRLLSETSRQSYMTLAFLRARYYANDSEFQEALRQNGKFNVFRRLESDKSRSATREFHPLFKKSSTSLARSKVAIWFEKGNETTPATAIVFCDPTVTSGKSLWNGINQDQGAMRPSSFIGQARSAGERSLFDHVVHAYRLLTLRDLEHIALNTQMIAEPALKIVIKEWLSAVQYMAVKVGEMEWMCRAPNYAENPAFLELSAREADPWRLTIKFYKEWVRDMLEHISIIATNKNNTGTSPLADSSQETTADPGGLQIVAPDLQRILRKLDEISERIERLSVMASSAITLEETRRSRSALQQNRSLGLLSFLATIFLPLNFATSFLSMSPDFSASQNTFRLFFAIGIPLTVIVISFIGYMQLRREPLGLRLRLWNRIFETKYAS